MSVVIPPGYASHHNVRRELVRREAEHSSSRKSYANPVALRRGENSPHSEANTWHHKDNLPQN